jgi:hypothetical protein
MFTDRKTVDRKDELIDRSNSETEFEPTDTEDRRAHIFRAVNILNPSGVRANLVTGVNESDVVRRDVPSMLKVADRVRSDALTS